MIRRTGWPPARRDGRLAGASLTSIGTANSTDDKTATVAVCFGIDVGSREVNARFPDYQATRTSSIAIATSRKRRRDR